MNTEQHNEKLTLEKYQLQQQVQSAYYLLGVLASNHGKKTKKGIEYRLTKAQLEGFDKTVSLRTLKTGGVVIELTEPTEPQE